MTNAPHLLPKSREGFKYGDATLVDSMAYDALYDQATQQAMGGLTEQMQRRRREAHPRGAGRVRGRARTRRPPRPGRTASSTTRSSRSTIPQRKGDPIVVTADEGVRGDTTAESLGKLRPAFAKDGTITAGSASQISDGACAVVVMSKAKAEELGLEWLAEIGAHGMVAGPDSTPAAAAGQRDRRRPARRRASPPPTSTWSSSTRRSPRSASSRPASSASTTTKVNVNGGAIALGHPVGMSGARVVLHLALELKRRGGGVGAAALCGGGGQGDALIVRVPQELSSTGRRPGPRSTRGPRRRGPGGRPADLAGRGRVAAAARGDGGAGAARRATRTSSASPARRASASRRRPTRWSPSCARAASGSACSRSTRRRRSPAARCSATGSGCRTTRPTPASSSARWPPAATSAGCPGRPRRRCGCSTPPAAT